jgi:hypothetical protein
MVICICTATIGGSRLFCIYLVCFKNPKGTRLDSKLEARPELKGFVT